MSYSMNKTGSVEEVINAIDADASMPEQVKDYLKAGIEAYGEKCVGVRVSAHGHLFSGEPGNYPHTTATLEVTAVSELPEVFKGQ